MLRVWQGPAVRLQLTSALQRHSPTPRSRNCHIKHVVHVNSRACSYAQRHVRRHILGHVHILCPGVYAHAHTFMDTRARAHTCLHLCVHVVMLRGIHARTRAGTHTRMHTRIHTRVHACAHKHDVHSCLSAHRCRTAGGRRAGSESMSVLGPLVTILHGTFFFHIRTGAMCTAARTSCAPIFRG